MTPSYREKATTIQRIVNKLSLSDAIALRDALPYSTILKQCSNTRADPIAYLSATFQYSVTLLSVMFDSGCVISGSQALNFFQPGSVRDNADWDFFVPGYKESVMDMINVLEICGVLWDFKGERIVSTIKENENITINSKVLESINSWIDPLEPAATRELLGRGLFGIMQSFRKLPPEVRYIATRFTILAQGSGMVEVIPRNYSERADGQSNIPKNSSAKPFDIIQGRITTKSDTQVVRLIIGSHDPNVKSCMGFIKSFYATHIQCFISGWCAGHMYYQQINAKQATLWRPWPGNLSRKEEDTVRNYKSIGFRFTKADRAGPVTRSFKDNDSILLDFGAIYRDFIRPSHHKLLETWLYERRENIDGITWTEFDGRIFSIQDPFEAYSRRREMSFSSHSVDLPLNRLRRLANLVALSSQGSTSLVSENFRSSIGASMGNRRWNLPRLARSGTVWNRLQNATPWSWAL
jgi:hypothetical protein